jgi:hypothetical protein
MLRMGLLFAFLSMAQMPTRTCDVITQWCDAMYMLHTDVSMRAGACFQRRKMLKHLQRHMRMLAALQCQLVYGVLVSICRCNSTRVSAAGAAV